MRVSTQILALDHCDYAFGLDWHPLRRGQRLWSECAAAARRQKASLALVRKGWKQFALAYTDGAQRYVPSASRPCYSAAMAAADALRHPTVFAAFTLEAGVYVVARVGGLMMPDGDRLFSDEEEARRFYERYTGAVQWATACRIAPAKWDIPLTTEVPLDEVLALAPGSAALRKPPHPPWIKWLVGASALAVIVAGGVGAYQTTRNTVRPQAHYEPLPAEITPFGTEAAGCVRVASRIRVQQRVPGWPLSRWQCGGGSVTATFARMASAPREWGIIQPNWVVSNDLENATHTVPVDGGPADARALRIEGLNTQADAERAVRLVAGTLRGVTSFATAPPRTLGSGDPPRGLPQWMRLNWTLTVSAPPDVWLAPLAQIPGTSFGAITVGDDKTTISGTTYVRQ